MRNSCVYMPGHNWHVHAVRAHKCMPTGRTVKLHLHHVLLLQYMHVHAMCIIHGMFYA